MNRHASATTVLPSTARWRMRPKRVSCFRKMRAAVTLSCSPTFLSSTTTTGRPRPTLNSPRCDAKHRERGSLFCHQQNSVVKVVAPEGMLDYDTGNKNQSWNLHVRVSDDGINFADTVEPFTIRLSPVDEPVYAVQDTLTLDAQSAQKMTLHR